MNLPPSVSVSAKRSAFSSMIIIEPAAQRDLRDRLGLTTNRRLEGRTTYIGTGFRVTRQITIRVGNQQPI